MSTIFKEIRGMERKSFDVEVELDIGLILCYFYGPISGFNSGV